MGGVRLEENERLEALASLPEWTLSEEREAIERSYEFANFVEAFTFMTKIAFAAEALNHHPEWFNVYGTVDVSLSTHEAGGHREDVVQIHGQRVFAHRAEREGGGRRGGR